MLWGLINGLAWTEVGGELLSVETAVIPGKGKYILTGSLGDVMKESISAAMTIVRKRSLALGIDKDFYENKDIHVHFPEGAVPKDGPSAGVGITTSLVSALTDNPVKSISGNDWRSKSSWPGFTNWWFKRKNVSGIKRWN